MKRTLEAEMDAIGVRARAAAVVLREASTESKNNALLAASGAIHAALVEGLRRASLPEAAIQMVPTIDHAAVGMIFAGLSGAVDLIVPRGGRSLVARVQAEARVPVLAHLEGICHTYVHAQA